jgi:uncharacterized Zn finger protein (UPF0148 family)
MTTNTCPRCRCVFRVPADEWGEHPCPRCGWEPDESAEEDDDEKEKSQMTLPINELCDYYISHYPVKGDTLTIDDVAEDAKVLAFEVRRLLKVDADECQEKMRLGSIINTAIAECKRQEAHPDFGQSLDPQRIQNILEEAL